MGLGSYLIITVVTTSDNPTHTRNNLLRGFPKLGAPFCRSHNKDHSIWGSILGSRYPWNLLRQSHESPSVYAHRQTATSTFESRDESDSRDKGKEKLRLLYYGGVILG